MYNTKNVNIRCSSDMSHPPPKKYTKMHRQLFFYFIFVQRVCVCVSVFTSLISIHCLISPSSCVTTYA